MKKSQKFFQKLIIALALITGLSGFISTQSLSNSNQVQAVSRKTKRHARFKKSSQKKRQNQKLKSKIKIDSDKTIKRRSKTKKKQKPTAKVYLDILPADSDYQITLRAMKAWNRTKAFKFTQTKNPLKAKIWITNNNYGDTSWAGVTEMPAVPHGYRHGAVICLNDFFLDQVNNQTAVDVAEHELGHAIGLTHNSREPSVMNPVIDPDHPYSIKPCDVRAVKAIYKEK